MFSSISVFSSFLYLRPPGITCFFVWVSPLGFMLIFYLPENVFILLSFLKASFLFFIVCSYFISTLCNYFPLSFGFIAILGKLAVNLIVAHINNLPFVCFWISEVQLWCVYGWVLFYLSYMGFIGLLEHVNWCHSHDIWNILFHYLFKYFLCEPLSPLLLDFWLNLLRIYFFIFHFWQSLRFLKKLFCFSGLYFLNCPPVC